MVAVGSKWVWSRAMALAGVRSVFASTASECSMRALGVVWGGKVVGSGAATDPLRLAALGTSPVPAPFGDGGGED